MAAKLPAPKPLRVAGGSREWTPKLELPKGGGAIKGVGEKLEAIAFTGSASYTIPIATSPGRGGARPQLALSYSSGAGNGPFGTGWALGAPAITRKTEGELPQYADGRESDTFELAGAEDLVPLTDSGGARVILEREQHIVYPYRPRVEATFARIERWVRRADGDTHWRILSTDNTTSWFGQNPQARLADPEDPLRVFSWLVEQTQDDRGNITSYTYKADVGEAHRAPATNRYLKRIHYGNRAPGGALDWMFEVVFDYGEHADTPEEQAPWPPRNDAFSSYRSGFEVRTRRLCRRVLMFHHFPAELGAPSTLVASTDLDYDESMHLAKLVSVTHMSYEPDPDGGYLTAAMPAIELSYTEAQLQPELHDIDAKSLENLPYGIDGDGYRLIDLDGEGLPGILAQIGDNLHYKAPMGAGRFGALKTLPSQATSARLGESAQLADLNGDGLLELVQIGDHFGGSYSRTADGRWDTYTSFRQVTTLDPGDPGVRQVDLDASGLPDLLVSFENHFLWVPSLGTDGYASAQLVGKPGDERAGPAVAFDDPSGTLFFADMCGHGLQDIVRIGNGAVHYWPNLGRGRFGRRVTMADAPAFAAVGEYDPARVRLADIDGSGTTDVLYIDHHGARAWFNLSGNGFSQARPIRPFPGAGPETDVEVADLLGKGTACLIWSQRSGWAKPSHVKYLDLMGDKPHLLVQVVNNMGLQTRIQYEPSTMQYLRDRDAGQPWLTRLPFPVHVATRIEHYDAVSRRRFVQRCSYHHGYYDALEREFHGFARVDRWDTEAFEDFHSDGLFALDLFDSVEEGLHQPPVLTRSWFHTGAYFGASRISRHLEGEYWDGDTLAWLLPDTVLPQPLTPEETREATRALRGRMLREEVFALDGSPAAGIPYTVTEANHGVRLLQPRGSGKHAVFLVHDREALSYHYERQPTDPRIGHNFTLEVDDHGNVVRAATVSYPRRTVSPGLTEQGHQTVLYTESSFAGIDEPDAYRAGIHVANRTFELPGIDQQPVGFEELHQATLGAGLVLLTSDRTFYYSDDLSGPLPLGSCGTRALIFEAQTAALSDSQLADVFGADADEALMVQEGGYVHHEQLWWARSPRQELDPARFFVPVRVFDPFGDPPTTIDYDAASLFPIQISDSAGTVVSSEIDYRLLTPRLITDANVSRTGVSFDTRGMVVATFVMGAPGSGLGDTAADPTTVLEYDVFAWQDRGEPVFVHSRARVTHADPATTWTEKYGYSNGSGTVILEKVLAEPGDAPLRAPDGSLVTAPDGTPIQGPADPRWAGTGRVVVDNKGNVVKRYEPYFSRTAAYEDEAELREHGVTPILHYDPLGRLRRTDFPNGTVARAEVTAWTTLDFDPNDTVLESDWFAQRAGGAAGPQEQRAAQITAPHANTMTVSHIDSLGRVFLIGEQTEAEILETRMVFDVQGNVLQVIDARGNVAETRVYGMLSQPLGTQSIDAGWRRALTDVSGAPLREWNERGFAGRIVYDALRRPTHRFVAQQGQNETLLARTVWGDEPAAPAGGNLRRRVYRIYDASGETTNHEYDFKGNLVRQSHRLALSFESDQDWLIPDREAALETETFTTTTEYDALNRVTSLITPDGSETLPWYNPAGLLESVRVRLRGDAAATTFVSNIDYNARGQHERCVHGNGTTTTFEYDPQTFRLARLHLIRDSDSLVLQDLRYTYDPAGNIVEIRDGAQQIAFFAGDVVTADQLFQYDSLYRLIIAGGREHTSLGQQTHADISFGPQRHPDDPAALRRYEEQYTWDETGNLLTLRHLATSGSFTRRYEYTPTGNRLLATSAPGEVVAPFSHTYSHDAHGNVTSMPHLAAMDWDHADRLRRCSLGGGGNVWFVCDATGRRTRKIWVDQPGGLMRERIYLGSWEIWREWSGGTLRHERQTLHIGDDSAVTCLVETRTVDDGAAVTTPVSRQRFQHRNHLGSASLELDEQAQIISYEEYHPFGSTAYAAASSAIEVSVKRYRYLGRERDEETSLLHCGARYYASWLGRWTSADPVGLGDGVNRFAYARGNPVSLKDPSGTMSDPPEIKNKPVDLSDMEPDEIKAIEGLDNPENIGELEQYDHHSVNIDEHDPVGEKGISKEESMSRARDPDQRGFLDDPSNTVTKKTGRGRARKAPRKAVSVVGWATALFGRRFSEVKEMKEIFAEALAKIPANRYQRGTRMKKALNAAVTNLIKYGTSEAAKLVREAFEKVGFRNVAGKGMVLVPRKTHPGRNPGVAKYEPPDTPDAPAAKPDPPASTPDTPASTPDTPASTPDTPASTPDVPSPAVPEPETPSKWARTLGYGRYAGRFVRRGIPVVAAAEGIYVFVTSGPKGVSNMVEEEFAFPVVTVIFAAEMGSEMLGEYVFKPGMDWMRQNVSRR